MDVKNWLETTGIRFKEIRFIKAPNYPYGIYFDSIKVRGSDEKNCIAERSIEIELYSEIIDEDSEKKLESLFDLKSLEYNKTRDWIDSEKHFQTLYVLEYTEKMEE